MESLKTDSTVKEGPRRASSVESSGSSGVREQGRLRDLGGGLRGYSLGGAGPASTDTGRRLSLESMSWTLVRRVLPSAVLMTLLARGSAAASRPGRGAAEPLTRVLSVLRSVGRPGACPPDRGGRSDPLLLAERRMPRVLVAAGGRSLEPGVSEEVERRGVSEEVERRGESEVRCSWLPDYRQETTNQC